VFIYCAKTTQKHRVRINKLHKSLENQPIEMYCCYIQCLFKQVIDMLTNYIQTKIQQPVNDLISKEQALPHLTVSYDMDNYYSLLSHIAKDAEQRWILFIAPPGKPNTSFMQQSGILKNRIITVPQNKVDDHSQLLKSALKSGNYSTVITWLTDCDKTMQDQLTELAKKTDSTCFIYCTQ